MIMAIIDLSLALILENDDIPTTMLVTFLSCIWIQEREIERLLHVYIPYCCIW